MKIAVIGAGPAGILLVAEAYLQCKKNNQNDTIIYWYDKEHFLSGMMDKYQVPSNTKMDYLDQGLGFFTESPIGPLAKLFPAIQQSIEAIRANSIPTPKIIETFDPSETGWPQIKDMRDHFVLISNILKSTNIVKFRNSEVKQCIRSKTNNLWTIRYYNEDDDHRSDENVHCINFCCGAKPATFLNNKINEFTNNTANIISMEDALSFDKVKNIVNKTDRIAILGNSHSSALAIKNFIEASNVDRENIFVYRLFPLKYAKWHDQGSYMNNSTGIKGIATAFAIKDRQLSAKRSIFNREEHSDKLWQLLKQKPTDFDHIVPLVGFEINKLPEIIINDNETINNKDLIFKAKTTELFYKGTSIGFEMGASRPEYYTDHPKFKYPIIALRGGEETKRKGWSGEYPVGWALFRLRAIQIVKAILGNDNIMNDKEASTIAKL